MKLDGQLTVDELEDTVSAQEWKALNSVTLPLKFKGVQPFCTEAILLQAIITASRKTSNSFRLQISDFRVRNEGWEDTLKDAFGGLYLTLAWFMANEVVDGDGIGLEKNKAVAFNTYLDAMESYEFMDTHHSMESRANLVSLHPARREYIRALYSFEDGKPVVRSNSDFRLILQDILAQIVPNWSGKTLRAMSQPLARLARELMENADLWARTDADGHPYSRGVQAITLRLVDIDDKNVSKFCGPNPSLHTYLQSMLLQKSSTWTGAEEGVRTRRNFIELTIVDSGPGLARRWIASHLNERSEDFSLQDITREQEAEAVAQCFQKWGTSSHDADRGIGLFAVAKLLRERNGFMRLRTGRLAYFFGTENASKNFQDRSDKSGTHHSGYSLLDDGTHLFKSDGRVEFFLSPWNENLLSHLEGTTYSILLPVQGA